MTTPGKTVSFAPHPALGSVTRTGLDLDVSIRQDNKIRSAVDNAIKLLLSRGFTEKEARHIVTSIKEPHDEKYKALEKEYFLLSDKYNTLEQQLHLAKGLAPQELVVTNTITNEDGSHAGETIVAPSYIMGTILGQSATNLNEGFQKELEALREANQLLIIEKADMLERLEKFAEDKKHYLDMSAQAQMLSDKVENYKALLLTKDHYASEIEALTLERDRLAEALAAFEHGNPESTMHNKLTTDQSLNTDIISTTSFQGPEVVEKASSPVLITDNNELDREHNKIDEKLSNVHFECLQSQALEDNTQELLQKAPLQARLDVSSITPEHLILGLTEKPANIASTLEATRNKNSSIHNAVTAVMDEAGTASAFRRTDFFDELANDPVRSGEIQVQLAQPAIGPVKTNGSITTSSSVSPVSQLLGEPGISNGALPDHRPIATVAQKSALPLSETSQMGNLSALQAQLDSHVELSEAQVTELAQQLVKLETEKLQAVKQMEQIKVEYAELQGAHTALTEAYNELAKKCAIQENRKNQLEEEQVKLRELFRVNSPARHISSIDISQSSQQERNLRLVRIRESDLNVGDLTSSGHHITEADQFLDEPPSNSAQSFAELPDGNQKAEKVKAVLVWKEKCSQLESRINYVLKDVDTLKEEKRDLEEELDTMRMQQHKLEMLNKDLHDEVDRLKKLLDNSLAEVRLFKTANNGVGKQLQQLLNDSVATANSLKANKVGQTATNTMLLVEQARDLLGADSEDSSGKLFTEDEVNMMLVELRNELLALRLESDKHQEAAVVFADEIRLLSDKVEGLTTTLAEKDKEIVQHANEIANLSTKLSEHLLELKCLQEELVSKDEQINLLSTNLFTVQRELAESLSANAALVDQIAVLTTGRNTLQAEIQGLQQKISEMQAENAQNVTQVPEHLESDRAFVQIKEFHATSTLPSMVLTVDASISTERDLEQEQLVLHFEALKIDLANLQNTCKGQEDTINGLTKQNNILAAEVTDSQKKLARVANLEEQRDRLLQENQQLQASYQRSLEQYAGAEELHRKASEKVTSYEDRLRTLQQELSARQEAAELKGSIMTQTVQLLVFERGIQCTAALVQTQSVQVSVLLDSVSSIPKADTRKSFEGYNDANLMTSTGVSTVESFLESIHETNQLMGIEPMSIAPVNELQNSTLALANLINQHTARMEQRLNEYTKLLQRQNLKDQEAIQKATDVPIKPIIYTELTPKHTLLPDVVMNLHQELQLISDQIKTNNKNMSSVARTTEIAFTKLRETLAMHLFEDPTATTIQHEQKPGTDLAQYANLLTSLLENIIRLNSRLDTMEKDRKTLLADLSLCLHLPSETTEDELKRHLQGLMAETASPTIDPQILMDNIADLKKNILETDIQLQLLEENAREQVRAASAPLATTAFAVLSQDSTARSVPSSADVKNAYIPDGNSLNIKHNSKDLHVLELELEQKNQEIKRLKEQLSKNKEHTDLMEQATPNTVEHLLQHNLSHDLRSVQSSMQQSIQNVMEATTNCQDATRKYLEERIAILEADNNTFKEFNGTYVSQLAEQAEEINRLRTQNHQLSLKLAEQNSFKEQIQLAEKTRKGITEQIKNVRSTLVEIKTCIQSEKSNDDPGEVELVKESKGIEAVEAKLIEVTEDACNWRMKYEKANAERKEMRARARTEYTLRVKVEKTHKKLEHNFAQLQAQLKEGNASLAWLKAATARYIEAVQQELDRLNGLNIMPLNVA